MDNYRILISFFIIGIITFCLRALPFSLGFFLKKSVFISYVKERFPMIMMFILTVYAANVPRSQSINEILPEIIAIVMTGMTHWFLKNFFLSIFVGVSVYITLSRYLIL